MASARTKAASDEIARLVREIAAAVKPVKIILFGSHARGTAKKGSDIDLLVVMPDGTHRSRVLDKIYGGVSGGLNGYDIVVATESGLEKHRNNLGLIYKSIIEEGRTVYDTATGFARKLA